MISNNSNSNQNKPYEQMTLDELEQTIQRLRRKADLMKKENEERKKRDALEQKKREEEERQRKLAEEKAQKAHVEEVTSMDLPLDWTNLFLEDDRCKGVHVDSIPDALIMCLTTLGKVDIEYISSITGEDYKTVICTLKGSIYQNPDTWGECFFKGWETADEYLSGNLKQKWRRALQANEEYNGYFQDNIDAIVKVFPPELATEDIYITLGSPWVPADVIDDFIDYLFGFPLLYELGATDNHSPILHTIHDESTGTWEIPRKNRFSHNLATTKTFGTDRVEALHILEKSLNMKTVCVTDEVNALGTQSGKARMINKEETLAALEKQKKMIKEFQKWVWTDKNRAFRLKTIFENKYGCIRRRIFDGSFLTFPGMSEKVSLYPYQKDAVARIIFSPNTLLAHDVGSGKTYTMIAAGQEMKRMGLSKKNLYVVPNNIVGQWRDIFSTMYPDAKLLCIEPKDFKPTKRQEILEQIRDEEFNGIIMAYSCFSLIPISRKYYQEELESQEAQITEIVNKREKATNRAKKKMEVLRKALMELKFALEETCNQIYFDELGITRLFVDEAHNFKNVPIETQTNHVLGISANGSKKCKDMMDKVHMVQKQNDGKGVIFATGTPITNSLTDAYIMQQYLQSGDLAMLDLQSFDGWIGMFAEQVTEFEIDVDTSSYRMATRFAKFHNLPELTSLLASIADFHQLDASAGIPEHDGYHDALIAKTVAFQNYLDQISQRADDVRSHKVSRKADNMLKITTDGRKAALDLRLADPNAGFTILSKVVRCAENVTDIYKMSGAKRGTQLVFCDSSTPKKGFNIYDELKNLLVKMEIPEEEIAFIHDADTEKQRAALFKKVQKGEIRILLGSTFKLGIGVNIQNKLVALHHLDVPWRPADMTQREGRILRQGNENKKVSIYRYITEGSFDAYSWQLLETKQRFITDLLSGSLTDRSGADIEDTILDYAEVKALAVGNPLVKERVEAANELTRYTALQNKLVETRLQMEKEHLELPAKILRQHELIEECEADCAFCSEWREKNPEPVDTKQKKAESERRRNLRESIHSGLMENVLETKEKRLMTYRGFNLILPANMTLEKPFIFLSREGRYKVDLGDTEVGNLIRIDNYLDELDKHLEHLKEGLLKFEEKKSAIELELSKDENYMEQIAQFKKKVAELDEKLGVNK